MEKRESKKLREREREKGKKRKSCNKNTSKATEKKLRMISITTQAKERKKTLRVIILSLLPLV